MGNLCYHRLPIVEHHKKEFWQCCMNSQSSFVIPIYKNLIDETRAPESAHEHIGRLARMSVLDTEVDGSNPGSSMLFP